MTVTRIDFVDNATTREAGIYAVRYGWAFAKGVTTAVSYVCIAEARAERDKASKAQVKLQERVEQLTCAVEAERSGK